MSNDSIYRPFSKLVPIQIMGRRFDVPENNTLLRCFQYLEPRVPYGPYCWNGDCENDSLNVRDAANAPPRRALACQTLVRSGMVIESLSADLTRSLSGILEKASAGAAREGDGAGEATPVGGTRRDA